MHAYMADGKYLVSAVLVSEVSCLPCPGYLNPLGLSFLINEMRIIAVPTPQDCCEDQRNA